MSSGDRKRLLEELTKGPAFARAAKAAGYDSKEEAAADLEAPLPRRATRASRSDPAEALPGACSERSPYPPRSTAVAHSDGASRGNPGPASYGCVYLTVDGTVLCAEGAVIGNATNNIAEYRGAIAALTRLRDWGESQIILRLDSQLIARQLDGSYKVKNEGLKPLHAQAKAILAGFSSVKIEYIPRKQNALADHYANLALDGKLSA